MDERGNPLSIAGIRTAAQLMLQAHVGPTASIGKDWASWFVERRPALKSKYTRKYDAQRALC